MSKRMLIDATHAEETRVVVMDGNRLEDYDVESAAKKQLKGNIYLARVIRVEPSLQAAFVEYGATGTAFLPLAKFIRIITRFRLPTAKNCSPFRPKKKP